MKYSELYKQLTGLIFIPLFLAAIFIFVMYLLQYTDASENVMTIFNLTGSIAVVLLGILIVRKLILADADTEYDINGIHFQLKNKSFLYGEISFSIWYKDIQEITINDTDNYRTYVKIKTTSPKKIIFISPDKYENNASFISYWNDVSARI